ncbi:MAG: flagellar motor protein MotB [Acidobacteria bacterium]|nr:MAG: flagellar motor protein MotB [Acidobacteriota bacterium]
MKIYGTALCALLLGSLVLARQDTTPIEPMDQTPVFRVNVVARTTKAVNYRHRGGSTMVDLKGTSLMPQATGKAKVDSKAGRLEIGIDVARLGPAGKFGAQYLTYVLWAVTPEGRSVNLGEVVPNSDGKNSLDVTTDLQAFGLVITAEPYFAVTRPSNLVVVENIVRQETKGFEESIDARFEMLEGGQYTIDVPAAQLPSTSSAATTPLDLLEARNAVAIAKAAGAADYAADSLKKSQEFLDRAEDYLKRKQGRTPIGTAARGATQMAEDARILTLEKKEQERIAAEKRATEERRAKAEADAKAAAEAEASARAQSEEDVRKREQAEKARLEAEVAQARADAARAAALEDQQKAQAEAEKQRSAAEEAIRQKEEMRARLLKQLNQVLETKDTDRGLVVSMPDVLFDSGQYTLKPAARERLARISGIILAYPDLKLQIEGYTDILGSDEFNQKLSEKRAASVRDYLIDANVPLDNISARGLGKANPIADNKTSAGRKLNRRVEMIVSGDVIGNVVGTGNGTANPPAYKPASQSSQ